MDQPKAIPELNAVVMHRNLISSWLVVLGIAPDTGRVPSFVPGQFIVLGVPSSVPRCALAEPEPQPPSPRSLIRRAYSIASSPHCTGYFELYVALVPKGHLAPRLFSLKIGDRVWVSPKAAGQFTFRNVPDTADVVLVATGAGLAPYVSMLSTHLALAGERRVVLIHGVRHSWDLGYRSLFMAMENLRKRFTYIPLVSRPQDEPVPWRGATGHVQELWSSGAVERIAGFRPAPGRCHVFLCGIPEMIDDMGSILQRQGFHLPAQSEPGEIHAERYWARHPRPRIEAAARAGASAAERAHES